MLDGAARVQDVVAKAAADGQPAVGITDHGNMYGVLDFYRAAREADVKPVLGMEAYFVTTSRFERPRRAEHEMYHLTLLALTNAGYKNLVKVSSAAYLDGFFYKPRVDFELLERHRDGLVGTSGCLGSAVCQRLLADDYAARARRRGALPGSHGARQLLHRAPGPRASRAAPRQHQPAAHRARDRRAVARHQRQPLRAPRRRRVARRAVVCADRVHPRRPEPVQVRRRRVLSEDRERDAPPLPRLRGGVRQHALDRRARRRRDRIRQRRAAVVRDAGRPRRGLVPARPRLRGRTRALWRHARGPCGGAARVRARRREDDGVLGLLPRRVGPRPVRAPSAASGSVRVGGARPARVSRTASASSTSTPSATTCCSSAS